MRVIVFATLLLITVGALITASVKTQQPSEPQERGTLKWLAQRAKDKGEQQVVTHSIVEYAGSGGSMEEALSYYSVVIAQPIEERTYVHDSEILTWYKFRIMEVLSQKIAPPCSPCFSSINPPGELLPLNANEFLVSKNEGAVLIDDVKVIMKELDFPPFSKSERYLLLLQ